MDGDWLGLLILPVKWVLSDFQKTQNDANCQSG